MPAIGNPWEDLCSTTFDAFQIPGGRPAKELFHYTNVEGFQRMVSTGRLSATHVRYMADAQEISYGRRLLHEVLLEEASEWKPDRLDLFERQLLDLSHTSEGKPTPVYAVSFSESLDDMSQWDRYADGGRGYALGFLPAALETIRRVEAPEWDECVLRRVMYKRPEQRALLRSLLQIAISLADNDMNQYSDKPARGFRILASSMARPIVDLLSIFKHPAFRSEHEWRLMYVGGIHESEGMDAKFRPSPRGMAPFVELHVPPMASHRAVLPLSKVVTGPALPMVEAPLAAVSFLAWNVHRAATSVAVDQMHEEGVGTEGLVSVLPSALAR